jgi:biotin operon repressor
MRPFYHGEKLMSQLANVAKHLRKNTSGAGITPQKLAKLAGVSKETVYKRISDLRNMEGHTIYSNYRNVNGQRQLFYRMATAA